MQNQDWNDWRHFLAILRNGNMAAAARSLGVNHSTVFRRLNAMEKRLGVRLFERLPGGYVPTTAGESLRGAAERVEQEVLQAETRLLGQDLRPGGNLRLTTTDDLAITVLMPHLAAFQQAYPEIDLELVSGNLLFDMTRREADIAIRPTARPPEHLVGRDCGAIGWAVYASPDYLRHHGRPEAPEALAGHRIVGADESLANIEPARWMARHCPMPDWVFRSGSLPIQLAAVQAGVGIAILPCFQADIDPRLQRLFGPIPEASRTRIWLLTHPGLRQVARVKVFMDFIAEALRGEQQRLAGVPTTA